MAMKVLGIEIGERLIKVCETTMGQGARKVTGCAMFQTPPEAVADGEIKDPDAVAGVLRENLVKNGLKSKKVVFAVSSGRIATREVVVPPVRENRLKLIVEANAADYFPVDMSKYHITHTLQERRAAGEDAGCRLLVMAAPIAVLEGYFHLAELLGLQIQAIDYSGHSQYRLYETLQAEGVTLYVDINGSFSVTTVMSQSKMLMQRTFPSGVDDYVLAYMGSVGRNDDGYLQSIRELGSGRYFSDADGLSQTDEYLSRLVGNITRIADYFNSSNWETPIERLVLTGSGASISGLREAIAETTGLQVAVMHKIDRVAAPAAISGLLPQYIASIGCAISPVDLIPERFSKAKQKDARKKKDSISFGVTVLIVGAVGALALSASSYLGYLGALDEKAQIEGRIEALAPAETVYENHLAYAGYRRDTAALETLIASPNDLLLGFFAELEEKMPSEVSVLSASCTKDSVSMFITVETKAAAAKAIQQLRTFESIAGVTVGQVAESADEGGYAVVTFSVSCTYAVEPSPEPVESAAPEPSEDGAAG